MNLINDAEYQKLVSAFRAGLSIRASARFAGVANNTAQSYFNMQPPIICPCGKPLPHRAWCAYRVALSPKRQEFLKSFVALKPSTMEGWGRLKAKIDEALGSSAYLCTLDHETIAELKRFYMPPSFGTEFVNGEPRLIAVAEATQENTSFALFSALEHLHPAVKKMVLNIIDGASVDQAAAESGISNEAIQRVMPPLKVFLRPYVSEYE